MPPKKKGKGNKLARMSEEEKLRYLQHRAAIEEEARRRKEHVIASYMKNKLKHEEAFTRLNTAKINQQWRQTLRQIKNQELRDACETLRQVFEVALKTKNAIIQHLSKDLDDASKQHGLAVQTHLVAVNKILDIRQNRLNTLTQNFEFTKDRNLFQADKELDRLESAFKDDEKVLKSVIKCEQTSYSRDFEELEELGRRHRDDLLHQLMAEMKQAEIEGNKRAEKLKKRLKKIENEYLEGMKPIQEQHQELLSSDHKSFALLRQTEIDIDYYQKLAEKLKQENIVVLTNLKDEIDEMNERVDKEKTVHVKLKKMLKSRTKESEKRMEHLSRVSNEALDYLKKQWEVVAEIKRYGLLVDGLQSNEERIKLAELELVGEPEESGIPLSEMSRFWERLGRSQVEVAELEAQYSNALEENQSLKEILKNTLNTIARPSSVPSSIYRDRVLLKRPSSTWCN